MDRQIDLSISAQETQLILNLLAERPFKEVADLVRKIMEQAKPQIIEAERSDG